MQTDARPHRESNYKHLELNSEFTWELDAESWLPLVLQWMYTTTVEAAYRHVSHVHVKNFSTKK